MVAVAELKERKLKSQEERIKRGLVAIVYQEHQEGNILGEDIPEILEKCCQAVIEIIRK